MKKVAKEHSFDIEVAKEHGPEVAIMLKNFQFWLTQNKRNYHNFRDGKYWTYNSYSDLSEAFPYWSIPQIKRILKKLKDAHIIEVGNYNKISSDRTNWYTIKPESGHFTHSAKSPNGSAKSPDQPAKSPDVHSAKSPDGLPDTNQYSNHTDEIERGGTDVPTPVQKKLLELSDNMQDSLRRLFPLEKMTVEELEEAIPFLEAKKQKEEKPPAKPERKTFQPPDLEEVQQFFEEKQVQALEGEKFFDHFQSNGWKVGGKTKMSDWKAAARNWIRRMKEYQKPKQQGQPESWEDRNKRWEQIFLDSHAMTMAKQAEEERRNNEY